MRLTAKGRYAVTAMLDLALHRGDRPVTLGDIAARQDISLSYLEQIFARLRQSLLVSSVRGPGGGYRLARESHEISVAEVISAIEIRLDATHCRGGRPCKGDQRCLTHDLWLDLSNLIYSHLDGIRLSDLIARHQARLNGKNPVVQKGLRASELAHL